MFPDVSPPHFECTCFGQRHLITHAPCTACRPDYKGLGMFKGMFPDVPLMALTATATQRVQHDVREQLDIRKCVVFKSSFNRPNLRCGVCRVCWGGDMHRALQ
jgi:hypothetical protein